MILDNNEIYGLIAKSFSDQLTAEEKINLELWLLVDPSNLAEYNEYGEIWKHSNRLAMLSSIDMPRSLNATRKGAGIDRKQVRWINVIPQIAAIFVLAILFSSLYNLYFASKFLPKIESVVYQQVKATFGTQSRVELADGTIVHLNSGSTLRFPTSFSGMKTRNVELTGEGYFKVSKNSQQPFVVNIQKMQIEVLGTTFNVDAYPDNSFFTIALIEGSIRLASETVNGNSKVMEMSPNQVATYHAEENDLSLKNEDDLTKYTAWTEGKIIFSNDPVITVLQKLGNWYNVDIEVADRKLKKYRFTGTFIDEPLEQVLNILNLTSDMRYMVIPAQKLSDNSFSKRKIILKSN